MAEERLQKLMAHAGLCSRREAENWIRDGRVTVNGTVATLGAKADPETDAIKVDGKRLRPAESPRYLLVNKPREVMTTCSDPENRTTVLDLVGPQVKERVYPVGRLDYHSEGLLILTNDGDLAERLTHPRYGVVREYLVKVRGDLTDAELGRLMKGAHVDGRKVVPKSVIRDSETREGNSRWRIQVTEGRTHEVRELFFRAGHHVQRLRRIAIGPLRDEQLKLGEVRELTKAEVAALVKATRKETPRPRSRPRSQSRRGSSKSK
jgi:23S rRNA pseudouridine2605 synthase